MGYHYSYYFTDDKIDPAAGQVPPVIHEFGPLLWGEALYYDPRIARWVSEKPVFIEQYDKSTYPIPRIIAGGENQP